jgi:hypothetical protein
MSDPFITQNIDDLRAHPLDGGGYEITFRSTNEGLFHQLYVNGRLADWSESPAQRSFFLADLTVSSRVAILAVDREHLRTDFSSSSACPDVLSPPPWLFRTAVVRGPSRGPGDRVALLGDHATGQIDTNPLLIRDLWPAWIDRFGWGQDAFGLPTFGYDSTGAVGFAMGAFGAGPFGLDGDALVLETTLEQEGIHQLVLRRIQPDGQFVDGPAMTFLSCPPPAPPVRLEATSYDADSSVLTLQLEGTPPP